MYILKNNLKIPFKIIILLLIITATTYLVSANEINYNGSICKNESLGTFLLGDNFYLLCEHNLVNDYYTNESQGSINQTIYTAYKPPNLYSQSIFEVFLLREQNITPKAIRTDLVDEINHKISQFESIQKEETRTKSNGSVLQKTTNESIKKNPSNENEEKSGKIMNETKKILDQLNSTINNKTEKTTSPSGNENHSKVEEKGPENNQEKENFQRFGISNSQSAEINYLAFVASGLILLLIIYIVIHIFLQKKDKEKETKLLLDYINLMKKKQFSDEKIKDYFKSKGYDDVTIARAFKALVKKP